MGQIYGIDLCSELELEDGGSRPEGPKCEAEGTSLRWGSWGGRRQLEGLRCAVSSPSGVRGENPAAVDFQGLKPRRMRLETTIV